MKTKLSLFGFALAFLLSMNVNADTIKNQKLNLSNPDVRKCLIEASKNEGWRLASVYMNADEKLVMIFDKNNDTKIYTNNTAI